MKRSKSISITCFLFVSCLWGVCAGDGPVRITVNIDGGADFTSIQEALDSANSGDEIRVAPGTYNEAINFLGKAVHLYSSGGPSATIIDAGGLNASVVTCNTGENPDTILEGFTLTGGNSFSGGGMSIHYSSPTVKNCLFTGNSASTSGGGMYTIGSSPTVINSIFIENATEGFGGGMFNTSNSAPILINCTFTRNSGFGGGIVNWLYSTPALTNCIVWGNFSVGGYAQIHNESGST